MSNSDSTVSAYDRAAQEAVELGNRLAERDPETDLWEVASGLMAGAVQYWLFSRQPCGDPFCEECADIDTAEQRLRQLLDEVRQTAQESDYYHTPNDSNVGTA